MPVRCKGHKTVHVRKMILMSVSQCLLQCGLLRIRGWKKKEGHLLDSSGRGIHPRVDSSVVIGILLDPQANLPTPSGIPGISFRLSYSHVQRNAGEVSEVAIRVSEDKREIMRSAGA